MSDNKMLSICPLFLSQAVVSLVSSSVPLVGFISTLVLAPFFILLLLHLKLIELCNSKAYSHLQLSTISAIIAAHKLECIDFLKVDVEGAVSFHFIIVCDSLFDI